MQSVDDLALLYQLVYHLHKLPKEVESVIDSECTLTSHSVLSDEECASVSVQSFCSV